MPLANAAPSIRLQIECHRGWLIWNRPLAKVCRHRPKGPGQPPESLLHMTAFETTPLRTPHVETKAMATAARAGCGLLEKTARTGTTRFAPDSQSAGKHVRDGAVRARILQPRRMDR